MPPWGEDGASPNFQICPCCGVEFGYEDCSTTAVRSYRKSWIDAGALWFEPKKRPSDWKVENQLKSIPEGFE
jgi:hypothetical protein